MTNRGVRRLLMGVLCALLTMAAVAVGGAPVAGPRADWPVYRHDTRLTGVTLAKGKITQPEVLWEHYLGAPYQPFAANALPVDSRLVDLDGDGTKERFHLNGKTISVTDQQGKQLWSLTVDGHPLTGKIRVAKLFPERKGQQIIVFNNQMDSGTGQGYCFTFHNGVAKGELAWTTGPLTGQYAPTLIVDDVDGDGLPEVVTAPHYRVQIFNGQTGQLKAEASWKVGRNYGILLTRARKDQPQKDIYIVCDFVLHVDRIGYEDGKWQHLWGHKYIEPNSPAPEGRQQYIHVGPNPVADVDGDGKDEMVYMLVDAKLDDQWHLRVRDAETGKVEADIAGIWLWSVTDLDGDGVAELIYTPTTAKRPGTFCDVHFGRLRDGKLVDFGVRKDVRPILTRTRYPLDVDSIADDGGHDLLRTDFNGDGRPEVFLGRKSKQGRFEDSLFAVSLTAGGKLSEQWSFTRPGHRLNLIHAGPYTEPKPSARIIDLTTREFLAVNTEGKVFGKNDLGKPGGFSTTPIVVDVDADGRNEIVLQNASRQIVALRPGAGKDGAPEVLWSVPGVSMAYQPGYHWNGGLSPQAGDLTGDGRPEVVYASEDEAGLAAVTVVDGRGKRVWRRSIPGCAWGGLQAGVDLWTFGRFTGRKKGLDLYVDLHRRSKGSGEGRVLRGDTGEEVWQRRGLVAGKNAMPFGGGMPGVGDLNGDGADDLATLNYTIYGVTSGATGDPVFPPAFLWGPEYFGKWIAYSSPTLADLDGNGKLDSYLNSASYARGAYAAVRADGKPMWADFKKNDEGSDGHGPVGDFDGDGKLEIGIPVLNGTLLCLNAADGSLKWRISVPVHGDVVAGDVNGDGVMELVFAASDGKIHAVSGKDGREVWAVPGAGRPILADVTGDGLIEVIAVGLDGVLRVIGQAAGQ